MSSAVKTKLTVAEYLAMERSSETKHEYFDGDVFAMAGGTPEHSLIATNFASESRASLKDSPCVVFNSDLRVKVKATGLYTYPDVTIVRGEREFDDQHGDTLVNPTVIVEVLSKSTAAYVRGTKSKHYRKIESLKALLFIEQDSPGVDVIWLRPDGDWVVSDAMEISESIVIGPLGISISLAEIYRNVTFPPPAPESETGLFTIK